MPPLNTRGALLNAVRALRTELEQVGTVLTEAGEAPPAAAGQWTPKDTIAHLTSWRLTTAARLEAALRGGEPDMPWPAGLDEERNLHEINRYFFETNRDKPLTEVLRQSRETFDRVEHALEALPEADLLEPNRFSWLAGYALGPAVIEGTVEHFREHEPELRAALGQSRDGSEP